MSKEEQRQKDLERIKALRLMDDDFMNICFNDYIEGAQLLLKIILERDDLKVSEVKTQMKITNVLGRSLYLDIYATDKEGAKYDIEIQRADKGAVRERARFHSSLIDSDMLNKGKSFSDIKQNYVIFITENDVLGLGLPIYHVDRVIREANVQFSDGEHILYVNGAIKARDTALGKLMSDFYCTNADDMCYEELANRVRHYKETEEGVEKMCEIWEEVKNDVRIENAKKMINDGVLPVEKIAEYTGLSIEQVRELAGNKSA